jgi:hypothetical protein
MSEPVKSDQTAREVTLPRATRPNRAPARAKKTEPFGRPLSERLLDLSRDRMVDGIILSEVLGKPVSMRRRTRR